MKQQRPEEQHKANPISTTMTTKYVDACSEPKKPAVMNASTAATKIKKAVHHITPRLPKRSFMVNGGRWWWRRRRRRRRRRLVVNNYAMHLYRYRRSVSSSSSPPPWALVTLHDTMNSLAGLDVECRRNAVISVNHLISCVHRSRPNTLNALLLPKIDHDSIICSILTRHRPPRPTLLVASD